MIFSQTIYLDHQATTPVDERALSKMLPYFTSKAGNPHSSDHAVGWESARAVSESAQKIAEMIGADEDEILFTSGASEANNLALLGLGKRAGGGRRNRILVSAIEHKCVLEVARALEDQFGYQVDCIPVDANGRIQFEMLETMLDESVLAVSIMAVNNEIGTVQDIGALSEATRHVGSIFHCDAAQAPVAMDMSGIAAQVDLLSLSGHKMYGPQGIGALYIRRGLRNQIEPLIYGGGQQDGLRSGTVPVPLCVGMGAAAELMSAHNMQELRAELRRRCDRFVDNLLTTIPTVSLNGPTSIHRHPGNANLCFHGYSASELLNSLQPTLAASTGSACTTGVPEPSHVLRAIGLSGDDAEASVRFSLGFNTSDQDLETAASVITETLANLSNTGCRTSIDQK